MNSYASLICTKNHRLILAFDFTLRLHTAKNKQVLIDKAIRTYDWKLTTGLSFYLN